MESESGTEITDSGFLIIDEKPADSGFRLPSLMKIHVEKCDVVSSTKSDLFHAKRFGKIKIAQILIQIYFVYNINVSEYIS